MGAWFLLFAAIGAVGTWLARRYALARALVDQPGERRSHVNPTPRGGGIAIAVALVIASIALLARYPTAVIPISAFLAGVVAIAVVGFVDDHRPLSPVLRLAVHVIASLAFGLALYLAGAPAWTALGTSVACVALTNVWNFMDGIDGIAATQAVLAATVLAALSIGVWNGLALALAAACFGFLPFNYPRARIFMGDVGSGTLGFSIAALAGAAVSTATHPAWVAVTVAMVVSAFVIDAGLTLLRRILRLEAWWTPHTQHAYQAAARVWGHPRVTIAYAAWTVASVLVSMSVFRAADAFMLSAAAVWYACGALAWFALQGRAGRSLQTDL